MKLMLTILKDGQQDCPQSQDKIYFNTLEEARKTGLELLREFNCEVFIVRRIIKQGYYRTLGYFNNKNEYLR